MKTVCPAGALTKGIDIYQGDDVENLETVLAGGVDYIFNKAWEYQEDPLFAYRWKLQKGKTIRGAYDFFHPSKDPIAQANSFIAAINQAGGLADDDLPPMLDWESTDNESPHLDTESGLAWLTHVMQITKRIPVIYAGPYFLEALKLDKRFLPFGVYLAEYGPKCPKHVDPWLSAGKSWNFWQTSGSGKVLGMKGACDTDVFNGDLAALKAWIATTKVS